MTLVEDDDETATIDGIVVWQRRRPGAEGYGHIPPPYDRMADYVIAAANIARDVLAHLVDSLAQSSSSLSCAPMARGRRNR